MFTALFRIRFPHLMHLYLLIFLTLKGPLMNHQLKLMILLSVNDVVSIIINQRNCLDNASTWSLSNPKIASSSSF